MYVMSLGMEFEVGLGLMRIQIWIMNLSHTEDSRDIILLDFEFLSFAVIEALVCHRTFSTTLKIYVVFRLLVWLLLRCIMLSSTLLVWNILVNTFIN
jgi:hypothetical protein